MGNDGRVCGSIINLVFNYDKSLLIFNSDDQLIGNVGRGWVKLIPVQIATPLLEDSLMTEIAREIQLLQKQTDTFDKHHHVTRKSGNFNGNI